MTDLIDDGFIMLRDVGIQSIWLLVQDVNASLDVVKIIPMHDTDATSLDVWSCLKSMAIGSCARAVV